MTLSLTLWQIWLTVGAVCVALLRVIPQVQPIVTPWLPPRWRTVPGIILAAAGMIVGVSQAGSDVGLLTTAIVVGLVSIAGVFAPGALPAGAVAEPGVSLTAATKEIATLRAASKVGLVLLVAGLLGGCGAVDFHGPITPGQLDPGQICEEFYVGEQIIGSVCVANPLDLLTAERAFLAAHRETTGIRRMRP